MCTQDSDRGTRAPYIAEWMRRWRPWACSGCKLLAAGGCKRSLSLRLLSGSWHLRMGVRAGRLARSSAAQHAASLLARLWLHMRDLGSRMPLRRPLRVFSSCGYRYSGAFDWSTSVTVRL